MIVPDCHQREHATGERAMRTLLDVYEQVITENPGPKPGTLVLEHGFLADAGQRAPSGSGSR